MGDTVQEDLEEASERRFWRLVLGGLWTCLVVAAVAGVLAVLAVLLGWRRYLLLCALGLLAGASLWVAAAGSRRSRELLAMVLGAVTLPFLGVHLAGVAARGETALDAHGTALLPFLAHASGAAVAALCISRIWRSSPRRSAEDEPAAIDLAAPAGPPAPPAAKRGASAGASP
jgi:hypothetical protein